MYVCARQVFLVGVPEMGAGAATSAKSSAAMLLAAQSSLKSALGKLKNALPKLETCRIAGAFLKTKLALSGFAKKDARRGAVSASVDPETAAIALIGSQLRVDSAGLASLIEDAKATLSTVAAKIG